MFLVRDGSTYRRADSGYSHLGGINGSVESSCSTRFMRVGSVVSLSSLDLIALRDVFYPSLCVSPVATYLLKSVALEFFCFADRSSCATRLLEVWNCSALSGFERRDCVLACCCCRVTRA